MDSPMQIRLFGAFAVQVDEQLVPEGAWRLRKGKSLVKLLALSPERRVHRERATEFLWPDRAAEAAANNFHQALYVARRALEAGGAPAPAGPPSRGARSRRPAPTPRRSCRCATTCSPSTRAARSRSTSTRSRRRRRAHER